MKKFLAIVKREYLKIVWAWTFLIATLLAPLIAVCFAFVPMLIFSISGNAVRLAIVDQSGQLATHVQASLAYGKKPSDDQKSIKDAVSQMQSPPDSKIKQSAQDLKTSFVIEEVKLNGKPIETVRAELNERIKNENLDAYLIIPQNFDGGQDFELLARNTNDFVMTSSIDNALNEAVRAQRLSKSNINPQQLDEINKSISLTTKKISEQGEQKDDSGTGFGIVFGLGLMIYITLAIYGQMVMSAVIEEKETKIAEVLFSSAKPFELMLGKLVGVGLAGLTQLSIWLGSAFGLGIFVALQANSLSFNFSVPQISPFVLVYFFVFFLLGFFIYATIFALIGSIVTTTQEGGQFALIPVLVLMMSLYSLVPVIRDPKSSFSFWASIFPFTSPVVMPARIISQTPQLWEIGLSIAFSVVAIMGLVWLASRVYRVGMLMTGKRATIPEVWRWIRQS